MKPSRLWITIFILLLLFSYSHSDTVAAKQPNYSQPLDGEAEILGSWQGDYPVVQLKLLRVDQREQGVGYIGDAKTFETVWEAFKAGEDVPEIDFKANMVLFARNTQFYNRISIGKVNVKNGVAEVLAMETRSAMPIEENVAISLVVVPRKGIKSIRTAGGLVVISDDDKISKPLHPQSQTTAQTYVYECSDGTVSRQGLREKRPGCSCRIRP